MLNKCLFTSNSDEYETPQELYKKLNSHFNFTLDPCGSASNHKCNKYYTKDNNGLNKSWRNEIVFCNPPYSDIKTWVKKCYTEYINNKAVIVLLIPSRTDTRYFHDYILHNAYIHFIKGRLHFNNTKNGAPFPSMLAIFDPSIAPNFS